ncbi:hypothetical protein DID88_000581 [Monilinia fructigena]|uniref:DUF7514 domain-containing protein n=1 Tax=Monilinia fructigena TaxID=38457 RepID=A0A395II12_9HELO|nr:hypothetical protein DID88_000581 [Monilinia fructigena]
MWNQKFYGYLFDADKSPTPVLNALLRGIANYIIENVGSKEDQFLTPEKLALFYKAVGGNYDSLFVETTHPSISWIYASIGCQHALNPTKDDFAPPSIPCLTVRGFVRWQSIEKNGTEAARKKLRQRASPDDEEEVPVPDLPPRPEAQTTYAHVRPSPRVPEPTPTNSHPRSGYFEPSTREPSTREPPTREPPTREPPTREPPTREPSTREPPTRESTTREHSCPFPNLSSPTSEDGPPPHSHSAPASDPRHSHHDVPVPDPANHAHPRRHSHPRQARRVPIVSDTSDSSTDTSLGSDSEDDPSPKSRSSPLKTSTGARQIPRHPQSAYIPRSSGTDSPRAFAFSSTAPGSTNPSPISDARERERERERQRDIEDKFRRGQYPTNIDLNGKLSAPFLTGRRKREMGRGSSDLGRERERDLERERDRDLERERDRERDKVRSDSRGALGVKWRDLGDIAEMWRNGGMRGDRVSSHSHHMSGGSGEKVEGRVERGGAVGDIVVEKIGVIGREKERGKGIGGTEKETTRGGKDLGSKRDIAVMKTSQHGE